MDLEKKVQLLEQEVELLKNQIQSTLLEIKEQLLTNAYPSLRSDDAAPNVPNLPVPAAPIQSAKLKQEEAPADTSAAPSLVRKVSLNELNKPVQAEAPQRAVKKESLDKQTMAELENWLNRFLLDSTPERCREMIELYSETGRFTAAKREFLLQSLAKRQHPAPKQQRPQAKTAPAKAKPSNPPAKKPEPARANRNHKAVAMNDDIDKNNLVLRLIAGIQNAGVGVTWKRKDG